MALSAGKVIETLLVSYLNTSFPAQLEDGFIFLELEANFLGH